MKLTPGMRQYMEIKDKHPDCIVLFRMGDFYETFYEDAKTVSKELDIVLTARGKGEKRAPLAGIPYHALDSYLAKLVKKGYKICIVEQLEDPRKAKGLVKRGVTRIVTPGTIIEDNILNKENNNFIMSINKEKDIYGISLADISTGEFLAAEIKDENKLLSEIDKFNPAEIIIPISLYESTTTTKIRQKGYYINEYDDRFFWIDKSIKTLKEHFNVINLDGFGLKEASTTTSGALISYLKETQFNSLSHINKINNYSVEDYMILDSATQRNLELLRNIKDNTTRGTLFEIINKTTTSMGSRKLKRWMLRPLIDLKKIKERINTIKELIDDAILREDLREILDKFSDLERITARITYNTANAKDIIALKNSLYLIPELKKLTDRCSSGYLKDINDLDELKNITVLIENAIKEEPSSILKEGNIIKKGYNKELDDLRDISSSGKRWITELEDKEKERTGIKSLKIRYNKVFGYFIEITKANLHLVPEEYIRKQTQVNNERFITEELKEKENLILGSQDKIFALEYKLFTEVLEQVSKKIKEIQETSDKISSLDCIISLAKVSHENNYCRPELDESDKINIISGRHPVIENIEASFVENDCTLNKDLMMKIITGPNMAGKSTFLRQNALIVLLAQVGCYVPARSAKIGIVDRIFTRVGAYDDLSMGQSTFMVEMNETANILNNATDRSFVILDEIGRGTSTYDGFSLAWAIAEYLNTNIKAKTLFATHYHQLNKMTEEFSSIKNYNILVNEKEDNIIFLRKIIQGGTDKSYGIQVAKLAGLPKEVINRSKIMMETLEKEDMIMKKLESEVISQKELPIEKEKREKIKQANQKEQNIKIQPEKTEEQMTLL